MRGISDYVDVPKLNSNHFHDTEWLWGIVSHLYPQEAEEYYYKVLDSKHRSHALDKAEKILQLSPEWIEKLTMYNFTSKSK